MEFSQKRVLVVSPDIPYPPNHGGRVDVWNRLKLLRSLGFKVDLIATGKTKPTVEEARIINKTVENFTFCLRKNKIIDMFRFLPLQINSRMQLAEVEIKSEYDLTILESEYVYGILKNDSLKSRNFIMRIHNDEVRYFKELGSSAKWGFNKIYYFLESLKFKYFEKSKIKKIHNYMLISMDEFATFR